MKSGYGFACGCIYACLQYEYVHNSVVCLHRSAFVLAQLNSSCMTEKEVSWSSLPYMAVSLTDRCFEGKMLDSPPFYLLFSLTHTLFLSESSCFSMTRPPVFPEKQLLSTNPVKRPAHAIFYSSVP